MKLEEPMAITIGALLHDIGKFMQRTQVPLSSQSQELESSICPVFRGRYSHKHVLWTNEFFDRYFPEEFLGATLDNTANLAIYHHNPSTPLQTIIQEADRLSAGMDRKTYTDVTGEESTRSDYIIERLAPIFEEVCLGKNEFERFKYRYALKPLMPEHLFPRERQEVISAEQSKAVTEYLELWEAFCKELQHIFTIREYPLFLDSLVYLLERFTWAIPSATYSLGRRTWTDISLFDHLITTSAIASALYLYHKDTDTVTEEAIRERETKKFILINLDLSGIQDFIFDITVDSTRAAARILRARSFYLSLLMEGAVRLLCERFGLHSPSRVMDAGGRAVVLAPCLKGSEEIIHDVQSELDHFLWSEYFGELSVNLSWITISGNDFEMDSFAENMTRLNESAQQAKLRKMSSLIGFPERHLFSLFWEEYQPDKGLCVACGKRQAKVSVREEEDAFQCPNCALLGEMGRHIVRSPYLGFYPDPKPEDTEGIEVCGGYFRFFDSFPPVDELESGWELGYEKESYLPSWMVANYVPLFSGKDSSDDVYRDPKYSSEELIEEAIAGIERGSSKTFHHIALSSLRRKADGTGFQGRPYLAALKADVDNLGFLFGYGLRDLENKGDNRLTLSRYATLSRMMDRFFSLYLPHVLRTTEEYSNTYTIFAGGDDLFLIGPWDKTFLLAHSLYEEFRRYTCCNPDITLSGGLSLMKSRYPVNYMARVAETGLDKAKKESREKDSLHLWGEIISWAQFPEIIKVKDTLDRLINDPSAKVSRRLVYDFMTIKEMRNRFIRGKDMRSGTYASLYRYKLGRLAKQKMPKEVQEELLRLYGDYIEGDQPLQLAIQWALYLNRS